MRPLIDDFVRRLRAPEPAFPVVAVAGAPGIGKSTLASQLGAELGRHTGLTAEVLCVDRYTHADAPRRARRRPYEAEAYDLEAVRRDVLRLTRREPVGGADELTVVVVEGAHALNPTIGRHVGLSFYVDGAPHDLVASRLITDLTERCFSLRKALANGLEHVQYLRFIQPYRRSADHVVTVRMQRVYELSRSLPGEA